MKSFFASEDGAITVDWVVITAAVVGLNVVLMVGMIRSSLVEVSTDIGSTIDDYQELLK